MKAKKYSYMVTGVLGLVLLLATESLATNTVEQQDSKKAEPRLVSELVQKRSLLMDKFYPIKRERAE